jgi:hypothetical protein
MDGAIRLVRTRRGCQPLEREDRYDVLLHGVLFDQLYFNTRGYVGYLPCPPDARKLVVGESGVRRYQAEARRLNAEWATSTLVCAKCRTKVETGDDGIRCTECVQFFCDNCYDTGGGDGCHCHQATT